MRRLLLLWAIGLSWSLLSAEPINSSVYPFPEGTVLYKAIGGKLISGSMATDKGNGEQTLKFSFKGKWELNPQLQGVHVTPESGVVIIARTKEERQKLVQIERLLKAKEHRGIDIFILSPSVNRSDVTYTTPDSIRFE